MTAPLLPDMDVVLEHRPTAWERIRDWWELDPGRRRILCWLAPTLVTLLAALLRIVGVGHPHTLVFDETYYVKDAWSLWAQGYEGAWRSNANDLFAKGDTSALETAAAFVVHPPLGKWLIGLGIVLFGPGSSFGWRIVTALVGTLSVLVVYVIAKQLSGSIAVATIAGLFMAVDGLGIVLSRVGLLDGILTLFVLLGVLFLVLDRKRSMPALEDPAFHARGDAPTLWGRVLWRRPWVLAAGAALGAASSVKWSGAYLLAAAGLYLVVTDALARRRAGVALWPSDAAFRQGPVTFLLLVPVAAVVYVASWTGWFVTAGGYDRRSVDGNALASWLHYHQDILAFHVGLTASHPYASPAWQWPFLVRPTSMWVGGQNQPCFGTTGCIGEITSIPNPLIWYLGVAAAVYLLVRFVRGLARRSPMPWSYAIPLVGLAGAYLPWLAFPERTIFQFYTVVMAPFLILALVLALRDIAGRPADARTRRQSGQRTVVVIVVMIVLVSAFYLPLWIGLPVPWWFWNLHNWSPSWI
ncbi:dolichyl-phosphate-mannose--protein mannosyltransferase [Microbacterium sp. ASV81]|uniref:Polyprenol-phosphate-mannose--protein mannosyltransferase n=1 Tax=Microbacterium capsulatum TaxID=3041921 RepID=A0ABU0XFS3_9MICO|nr:phospholipid carrier-dependent glycosyltransferase [Microbacterium sp. ASV81]MDQ4213906.1 phospholipid carrier-dependent glycosyltransferase [Microbacterium sp. ASV81]